MAYSAEANALLARPVRRSSEASLDFRADIEGLRGISVAAVVLFHAFPALLPGGFIGVDVFFVISGFLITRILLREQQTTGHIDFLEFWCRRIRRILPAATVALIGTAFLFCLAPAMDARQLGKSALAAALFYLNWRQAEKGVDYLAAEDGDNPLLHYWSLGVEEQFYLFWPMLFTALLALGGRTPLRQAWVATAVAIAALAVIDFAYGAYLTSTNRSFGFFSTLSRAWQFLCGALVAVVGSLHSDSKKADSYFGVLSVGCLAVLAVSFLSVDASYAYPGLIALAPTVAAALLVHSSAHRRSWGGSVLAFSTLRELGRISFSLYLVHWPLIVAARIFRGAEPVAMSAAVVLSLILAAAMYRFVEMPMRTARALTSSKRKTLIFGAGLVAAGALTGLALRSFGPDHIAIAPGVFVSGEAITGDRPIIYDDGCLVRQDDTTWASCVYGAVNGTKSVVLFGDSHAANWFPALDAAAKTEGWRLIVRVRAACAPIDAPQKLADGTPYHDCAVWRRTVLKEIRTLAPGLIVVGSNSQGHSLDAEQRVLAALADAAPTVVMRDTPRLPEAAVTCLRRERDPDVCSWEINRIGGRTYPKTSETELPRNARILDLNGRLCASGVCRAVKDDWVLMTDNHHLTARVSSSFADAFAKELRTFGSREPFAP